MLQRTMHNNQPPIQISRIFIHGSMVNVNEWIKSVNEAVARSNRQTLEVASDIRDFSDDQNDTKTQEQINDRIQRSITQDDVR